PQAVCGPAASERIEGAYDRWVGLLDRRRALGGEAFGRRADSLVARVVDVDAMAARILRDDWRRTDQHRRREFRAALTRSL
ncbi:MAG: hypothetical protein GWO00_19195, partial [Gemmatimonadetes bacterium]|nr:hypothetical protein [Gemmatimonadota bacterium]NIR80407.1 hypothetical protein [Gemmatimonadota bacterium]NIT89167.1 hypothetical protein [Gemmatimonadota bacterium]NIU32967.1 hypothetical protein [Gemmatimonadota bacterium]NIV63326.1 hypothetical protein [Gemmatimonadota bacterium]